MRAAILSLLLSTPFVASAQSAGTLTVVVTGLEGNEGRVACSLFASEEGWPSDREHARAGQWAPIVDRQARCVFRDVPSGTYAVGVFHDEDGDGEMDTSIVGRPQEGWGVSNDAPPRRFGAPHFAPSSFALDGTRKTIRVTLRY